MTTTKALKSFANQITRPEKTITTYEDSKRFCRMPKAYPQRDDPPSNYKLQHFKAKHNLRILEGDVVRTRANYELMKEDFQVEWDILLRKAELLKKEIQICDNFVIGNEEKRRRFQLKMQQARETAKQKTEEAEQIREKIAFLKKIKKQMEDKITEYDMYEDYLNAVAGEKFKNASDVLKRFEALYNSKQEIAKAEQHHQRHFRETTDKMRRYLQEKFEQRTQLVTQLESLTKRYNDAKTYATTAENVIYKVQQESIKRKLELVTVTGTCWKLYRHMHRNKYTGYLVKKDDIKGQLQAITEVLGMMKEVFKKLQIPY